MSSPITRTLAVPLVDQEHEPTADGQPDENKNDNCLFAACASALMGYHPNGPTYDGDEIKDAVMGQGYVGFGYFSAKLTAYLAAQGVNITVETGSNLAAVAHAFIDRGIPLLAVIPSLWGSQSGAVSPNFSTHVVLLCGDGAGWLRAMNPWGGFWQDQPDGWWASRFCYGALWPLLPANGGSGIGSIGSGGSTGMAGVPSGWHDNGSVLTAPNGVQCAGYIRAHILGEAWDPELVPVAPIYGIAGGWEQDFILSRAVFATTAGAVSDHIGPDYPAQLAAANAEIAKLEAEIAALKATPGPSPTDPTAAPLRAALMAFLAEKG